MLRFDHVLLLRLTAVLVWIILDWRFRATAADQSGVHQFKTTIAFDIGVLNRAFALGTAYD